MAEKDMTEKALEAYNDVFADIVNTLIFHGKEKILEDELEQGRERSLYQGEKKLREQERDTSKYWRKNNIRIAYVGFENETEAEDDMPLRVIGYDGAAYMDQISYEINEQGKRRKVLERYPVVIRHIREVLQLLSVLTDDSRFQKTIDGVEKGDEPKNMSEALDLIEKRGIEQGIEQERKRINILNAKLLKDGRIKDLERSVSDSAYQEQLLAELFPE